MMLTMAFVPGVHDSASSFIVVASYQNASIMFEGYPVGCANLKIVPTTRL